MSKSDSVKFFNIPRHWIYLVGFEYEAVNKRREKKLAKGGKPVAKKIDYVDLLILDEIRSYSERGGKDCFIGAVQLADNIGLWQREKEVADKVLQMVNLGFIHAKQKFDDGRRLPKLVLSIDSQLIDDVSSARKESILEAQRMDSQSAKFLGRIEDFYILQEYLQEYLQEDRQEDRQEQVQEQVPEDRQENRLSVGSDCEMGSVSKQSVSTDRSKSDIFNLSIMDDEGAGNHLTEPVAHTKPFIYCDEPESETESVKRVCIRDEHIEDYTDRDSENLQHVGSEHDVTAVPISQNKYNAPKAPEEWPRVVNRVQPGELPEIEPLLRDIWELVEDIIETEFGASVASISSDLRRNGCYDLEYVKWHPMREVAELKKIRSHLNHLTGPESIF